MTQRILVAAAAVLALQPSFADSVCDGVAPVGATALSSVVVASGLPGSPLFVTAPPGDVDRIFIVEKSGRIFLRKRGTPPGSFSTFLDITSRVDATGSEMGLLGLAFDPDHAATGRFWVNYTASPGGTLGTVVSRFQADPGDPDLADPSSEQVALRIAQPEINHNGGMLAFGRDGFLYVLTGDGGGVGDQHGTCGNGQNVGILLGKILRIDVRGTDPSATAPDCDPSGTYGVPSTNPFRAVTGACDEIWAYGLRNPWRGSFDAASGDLYVADVGQRCWEEVNWVPGTSAGGENYGWRQMEGDRCFNLAQPFVCTPSGAICAGSPACNDPSLTDPVVVYPHGSACSVTGGYVYRGCKLSAWQGAYFYGDYCAGFVRSFEMQAGVPANPLDVTSQVDPGGALVGGLTSFGTDARGEIYVASDSDGSVRRIVPPFAAIEVSGPGDGSPLRLAKAGDWTWQDLFATEDRPAALYRVYRGAVNGAYACVFLGTAALWPGGDPAIPSDGELYAYVVTAVDAAGAETSPGTTGTFDSASCP